MQPVNYTIQFHELTLPFLRAAAFRPCWRRTPAAVTRRRQVKSSPYSLSYGYWLVRPMYVHWGVQVIYYQYNALWAMNERAQERCRRVTCTCHVGWKLPLEIPQSSTLKLESPYSSQDPKKRWSVQWRTCTDTPIAFSKPHIISISAHVANLSTISSAVPKI